MSIYLQFSPSEQNWAADNNYNVFNLLLAFLPGEPNIYF